MPCPADRYSTPKCISSTGRPSFPTRQSPDPHMNWQPPTASRVRALVLAHIAKNLFRLEVASCVNRKHCIAAPDGTPTVHPVAAAELKTALTPVLLSPNAIAPGQGPAAHAGLVANITRAAKRVDIAAAMTTGTRPLARRLIRSDLVILSPPASTVASMVHGRTWGARTILGRGHSCQENRTCLSSFSILFDS